MYRTSCRLQTLVLPSERAPHAPRTASAAQIGRGFSGSRTQYLLPIHQPGSHQPIVCGVRGPLTAICSTAAPPRIPSSWPASLHRSSSPRVCVFRFILVSSVSVSCCVFGARHHESHAVRVLRAAAAVVCSSSRKPTTSRECVYQYRPTNTITPRPRPEFGKCECPVRFAADKQQNCATRRDNVVPIWLPSSWPHESL